MARIFFQSLLCSRRPFAEIANETNNNSANNKDCFMLSTFSGSWTKNKFKNYIKLARPKESKIALKNNWSQSITC